MRKILDLWLQELSDKDLALLRDYSSGATAPNRQDLLPDMTLEPNNSELSGPLLGLNTKEKETLH